MADFFNSKKNTINVITLIVLYAAFVGFSWGKYGHPFYDCFREAVIPESMLDGKILYKDILNLYPPFAYQVNALLFKFFGCKLSVLFGSGIVCGFSILLMLYKTVRTYFSEFTAFFATLSVMFLFTFRICANSLSSWFFPYSYAFLYAFTFAFIAVCLYLILQKSTEKNTQKYFCKMCVIALFIGFSVAFKWDLLMVCLIPLFEAVKNRSFKEFFVFLGLMVTPSLLTFGVWLLSGGSIGDFCGWVNFLVNFKNAPSVIDFNENSLPQTITPDVADNIVASLKIFFKTFGSFCALFFLFFTFVPKFSQNKLFQSILFVIFFGIVCYPCFTLFSFEAFQAVGTNKNFVFLPYLLWICLCVIFAMKKIRKEDFTQGEKFFALSVVFGSLLTFRSFAEVKLSSVGNFTIIPYFVALVVLFIEILPDYIKILDKTFLKKIFALALFLFTCTISINYLYAFSDFDKKIETEKGSIFMPKKKSSVVVETLDYINNSIPQNAKILVVNEGLLFNWFSNKNCDLKHYALIPHIIEAYGEEKIIDDFEQNPMDYFIVTNNYYPYVGFWGIDYGKKLNNYIESNYESIKTFSFQYCTIVIWKKKC